MSSYAWGLDRKTNNEEEWLSLYYGMNLLRKLNITKIIVLGDSKQVIHKMNNGNNRDRLKLKEFMSAFNRLLEKSKFLISTSSKETIQRQINWKIKAPS